MLTLKNQELTKFAFDFIYNVVIENMNHMTLENHVWKILAYLIQNSDKKKQNNLVKSFVDWDFAFDSNWLNFYCQILEFMSHEQILHLISILLKNKELLKDEVSVFDFLRIIRSKMDTTPQLKKLFKTLYPFEKVYTRFNYDLLEPDTFEDALLMIPKIKELLLSLDFDGDTNVNQLIGICQQKSFH
jgi:hypothetical protein